MGIKLTYDFIKSEFDKAGYDLITDHYIACKSKLKYKCGNGHIHNLSWMDFSRGHRCAFCKGNGKLNIEQIRKAFDVEGYRLLSKEYINSKNKLDYLCPKGHIHKISWADWNSKKSRCPYCNGRPIYTIEQIKELFSKDGYELLSNKYINNKTLLDFICPKGHKHSICLSSWLRGRRCYHCFGNVKKDINDLAHSFSLSGYTLISKDYVGCQSPLSLICPNKHNYTVTLDNWNHNGSRCPRCGNGVSDEEDYLINYITSNITNIECRNRTICYPKELDIVIPEKKIAIEYCGLYWHSELNGKDKNYHLNKLNMCLEKGYRLITVFSDELNNKKDILLSRLGSILSRDFFIRIYGRKCSIKPITSREAKVFCLDNHIQGYVNASICLGAFYNDLLVSVMTFTKPLRSKGNLKDKNGVLELSRFCSKINHNVIGIASKLLKYFERNYEWKELFSYADRRWSDGNLYEKIGFDFVGNTKPNYWYLDRDSSNRIHRFALRKTQTDPKDQTEWEIRKSQGYNRIWDCGNMKFVKYNKELQHA